MKQKFVGYSAMYETSEGIDLFIPHQPGLGNYAGTVWPSLKEAADFATGAVERGYKNVRFVAVYEFEDV